jgi:hypothetical protein
MTMMTAITRINPHTGRLERPWRNREGYFILGDPSTGAQRHHDKNAVKVKTFDEAVSLVRRGHSIRMSGGKGPPSLIAADSLTLDAVASDPDQPLWVSAVVAPPFSRDDMLCDLRKALLVQAAAIAFWGNSAAAAVFAGFAADDSMSPYDDDDDLERLDLGRFDATRLMNLAYDYAYQTHEDVRFGDDTATELARMLDCPSARSYDRTSPAINVDSLFRRTADTAMARWLLVDRYQGMTVRQLALLASMKESAVRNALSREKISLDNGRVDNEVAHSWLKSRRDFIPLDDGERRGWEPRADAVELLDKRPFGEAIAAILPETIEDRAKLAEQAKVNPDMLEEMAKGRPSSDVEALRRVATALDLDVPHFVGRVVQAALQAG